MQYQIFLVYQRIISRRLCRHKGILLSSSFNLQIPIEAVAVFWRVYIIAITERNIQFSDIYRVIYILFLDVFPYSIAPSLPLRSVTSAASLLASTEDLLLFVFRCNIGDSVETVRIGGGVYPTMALGTQQICVILNLSIVLLQNSSSGAHTHKKKL